jgi:ribosomal protein S18 acetylase RimI-like enzyme
MFTPTVSLRVASEADRDFLLRVYASTRAAELAQTGWSAAAGESFVQMQFNAQSSHYRQQWPASVHSVIEAQLNGLTHPVGRLWVDYRAREIHVLDIALLPEWCGCGIGSACYRQLMREASHAGKALTIQVEQGNPARRLYERLGFLPVGAQQGLHQLMSWRGRARAHSPQEEACYEQT